MGLFNKIKDILFEDEEVEETETVKVNNEKKEVKPEVKRPIAEKIEPQRRPEVRPEVVREPQIREQQQYREPAYEPPKVTRETNYNDLSDRDLFKSENTFPFPDFDEEEFSSTMNRQQKKPTTNVLEYEKKKKIEKKYDYGRYERTETREVVEKKKFKPSPIISPVYGILNEDYKVEDIKDVTEENRNNNLDFNSVRKKAFGDIEALDEEPKETFYEETVTVKLKENAEEKKQKVKTIDELLEDTADVEINVDKNDKKKNTTSRNISNELDDYEKIDEDLEEIIPENKSVKKEIIDDEDDDTLENDLFELIDSMYDNREDGDY